MRTCIRDSHESLSLGPWSEQTQPLVIAVSQQQLLCSNNCQLQWSIIKQILLHKTTLVGNIQFIRMIFSCLIIVMIIYNTSRAGMQGTTSTKLLDESSSKSLPLSCVLQHKKGDPKKSWLRTMNRIVFHATSVSNSPAPCSPFDDVFICTIFLFFLQGKKGERWWNWDTSTSRQKNNSTTQGNMMNRLKHSQMNSSGRPRSGVGLQGENTVTRSNTVAMVTRTKLHIRMQGNGRTSEQKWETNQPEDRQKQLGSCRSF